MCLYRLPSTRKPRTDPLIWEKGTNQMSLPSDFDVILTRVQQLGITAEEPAMIRDRLVLAIREAAEEGQKSGDLAVGDLGFFDWSIKMLRRCEEAVHDEVCD